MFDIAGTKDLGVLWPVYGNSWTPIHAAAAGDRLDYIRLFHAERFDIDARAGRAQFIPLHIAILAGRVDAVETLLELGASIDAEAHWVSVYSQYDHPIPEQLTPLTLAVMCPTLEVLQFLLISGASLLQRTDTWTPIHLSVVLRRMEHLKAILALGTDARKLIDARDRHGATAVHLAVKRTEPEILRVLLEHGANPNIRDIDDKSPYETARSTQQTLAIHRQARTLSIKRIPC